MGLWGNHTAMPEVLGDSWSMTSRSFSRAPTSFYTYWLKKYFSGVVMTICTKPAARSLTAASNFDACGP